MGWTTITSNLWSRPSGGSSGPSGGTLGTRRRGGAFLGALSAHPWPAGLLFYHEEEVGWDGRIRTYDLLYQKQLPYR